ncbi:MAG: hypothetical protein Q8L88_11440, partial [Bacteroidota bacterium]|nr:hypothetical protein [Bacteroidota bacterium]
VFVENWLAIRVAFFQGVPQKFTIATVLSINHCGIMIFANCSLLPMEEMWHPLLQPFTFFV